MCKPAATVLPTARDRGSLDASVGERAGSLKGDTVALEPLQQFGRVAHNPAMHGRVVDRDPSLSHHLLQVPEAEIIGQIPADAEQDHRSIKMPALEHAILRR
jgi:hypothetical protein